MDLELAKVKIERIEGAVTFGELFTFRERMQDFASQLQGTLYQTLRAIDQDAKLEFNLRDEKGRDPMVSVLCRRPEMMLQATKGALAFRFDDVYEYQRVVPPVASTYYNTGMDFFNVDLVLRCGVEFHNILDFVRPQRNTDLFAERVVPDLRGTAGVFQLLGPIERVYRTDLHLSFACKGKNICLRLDAPANEENSTLWCYVEVRSDKPTVPREEVLDFQLPYDYYTGQYATFLSQLLQGKALDFRKRALLRT